MLDENLLADILTDRFGVPLTGETLDEPAGIRARFRPRDLPRTQGFSIEVLIGWRTIEVDFIPDTFAASLLASMENSSFDQRAAFATFISAAAKDGAMVTFRLNNQDVAPSQAGKWPSKWRSVILKMRKGPMVIDIDNPATLEKTVLQWGGRALGAVLALIPLEPIESEIGGDAEGGGNRALVTRYERSHINRAACLEIHGAKCKACGFEFEPFYGPIGRNFIEVHHVEMVSMLAPGTILDPAKDLVPVCANCHAMLHRRKHPYTVDELKTLITAAAGTHRVL